MNEIAEALDKIQYKTKKTIEDIAKEIGLTRPYLSSVKRQGWPIEILKRLQHQYPEILLSGHDDKAVVLPIDYQKVRLDLKNGEKNEIPVYSGNTRAGTIEIYMDDLTQQTPIGYLSAKVFPGCNHAEKVTGDSMYPLICNQAYVVGKIIDKKGIIWGEKYTIHTVHGQSVVKFIHPSNVEGCIKIVSMNKSIPDQDILVDDISFCCRIYYIINPS